MATHAPTLSEYNANCERVGIPPDKRFPELSQFLDLAIRAQFDVHAGRRPPHELCRDLSQAYARASGELRIRIPQDAGRYIDIIECLCNQIDVANEPLEYERLLQQLRDAGHSLHWQTRQELQHPPDDPPRTTPPRRMTWQQVRDAALKYLRTEGKPWPGGKQLARTIGCSSSTLRKACKHDAELAKLARDDGESVPKSRRELQMPDAVRDAIAERSERDDLDIDIGTLNADQSDDLIARLKAECATPKALQQFAAMTEDERLRTAIIQFSDPDTGRSTRSRGGRARAR